MKPLDLQPLKSQKREYRVRFNREGEVLAASLHAELGEKLGVAIEGNGPLNILDYIRRLEILHPDLPDRVIPRLIRLMEDLVEFSVHEDFKSPSGMVHLHISGRAARYFNGAIAFTLLFLDDTEHTRLRRTYELMFRLANHELKSPLACILGATEFAEEHIVNGNLDGIKMCIGMIERNARSMEEMLRRYLNLSRIESGNLHITPRELLLSEVVLEPLLSEFRPMLLQRGMNVSFSCEPEPEPPVYGDPEALEIALRNLLSNAIKYGNPGSIIKISLTRAGEGNLAVSVENEGPTIPKEQLDKLFDRFVRLEATQGTKGAGLGLYNARKVVELWGGTIRVESSDSHVRFIFTVPEA